MNQEYNFEYFEDSTRSGNRAERTQGKYKYERRKYKYASDLSDRRMSHFVPQQGKTKRSLTKQERNRRLLKRRIKIILVPVCLIVLIIIAVSFVSAKNSGSNVAPDTAALGSVSSVHSEVQTKPDLATISYSDINNTLPWNMTIINGNTPLSSNYIPETKKYKGTSVDIRIISQLDSMIEAASEDGVNLNVVSAFRSYETQSSLYRDQVDSVLALNKGYTLEQAQAEAAKTVSKPGSSEHQLGLAIDFNDVTENFKDTKEYDWLKANAAKYGFIQRYSAEKSSITGVIDEPWHYRYIGAENAEKISKSGLCLEEYIYSSVY